MTRAAAIATLLIALALLAECSGNDYGFLFQDAGTCGDASAAPDASC